MSTGLNRNRAGQFIIMNCGTTIPLLFLCLFLADASLSAAQVQATQPREGDVWSFQVSHASWTDWSSDAVQSGDYELHYNQGKLRVFRLSDRVREEISGRSIGPLRRMLGTFKGQSTLLQFPLFEGKEWKTEYRNVSSRGSGRTIITNHRITGKKSITIPAGTFEAFRIERDDRSHGLKGRVHTSEYFYVVACGCIALYSLEVTSAPAAWPRSYFGKREITLIEFRSGERSAG